MPVPCEVEHDLPSEVRHLIVYLGDEALDRGQVLSYGVKPAINAVSLTNIPDDVLKSEYETLARRVSRVQWRPARHSPRDLEIGWHEP